MIMGDLWHNLCGLLAYDAARPMLFSSGTFWALFLVFMPLYGMLKRRWWQMALFVVAFSLYFYYKSSGLFVVMLAGTSLVDWLLSLIMTRPEATKAQRKACVAISLAASLGLLAYFKYADFFLWNLNATIGSNFQPLDLILPVGISFYTFQSISYIVDVYKGRVAPAATWLEYAFFLSFFPALVAGPIVRADYFLPQIRANRHATRNEVYAGLWLVIIGIVKKAVIADYIAQYNDLIFGNPGGYSGFETLMGVIGYTMQIYCDFSGYSDMAIGIALIMGFKLAKNFDFPYKAQNLSDFWHRWHISLSTWLRDYVYIPLGGNRKGHRRTYVNSFVTMLIGGLWPRRGMEVCAVGGDARRGPRSAQGIVAVAVAYGRRPAGKGLVMAGDDEFHCYIVGVLQGRNLQRLAYNLAHDSQRFFVRAGPGLFCRPHVMARAYACNNHSPYPSGRLFR